MDAHHTKVTPSSIRQPAEQHISADVPRLENNRLTVRTFELAALLEKSRRVPFVQSLTQQDILIAILNGMSSQVNYALPAPPMKLSEINDPLVRRALQMRKVPDSASLVSLEDNPILFLHSLHSAAKSSKVPVVQLQAATARGLLAIDHRLYEEYLDTLQQSARVFREHSTEIFDSSAEFAALCLREALKSPRPDIAGAKTPIISIEGPSADGLRLEISDRYGMLQHLPSGSSVFVAGLGYNSLLNLNAMRECSAFNFIINEEDPFVAEVLAQVIEKGGYQNVRLVRGDVAAALLRVGEVNGVFVSDLFALDEEKVKAFTLALRQTLALDALIHVCQVDTATHGVNSTGTTWRSALLASGFSLEMDQDFPGSFQTSFAQHPREQLLQLSGTQLIAIQTREGKEGPNQVTYRYLVARTPTTYFNDLGE